MFLLLALEVKPRFPEKRKKTASLVNTETDSYLAVKFAERGNRSFSVYVMNYLVQIFVLLKDN